MSEAINRAQALIRSRLAELNTEAKDLERALASLGEKTTGRPGRPRKPAAGKAPAKRRRKAAGLAPRGQRREQLLAAIKTNPGARPSDLAREIGISANQVHALIAKARKDKLLVRKGKGYALKG
jgi:predicted Rossmann fold nucleotide-binding protein DprA/Smf involved in DNA uptake